MISTNRGKLSLEGVAEKALNLNIEKIAFVSRWKGDPGKIQFYRIDRTGLSRFSPSICIKNVKLRRAFKKDSPQKRINSLSIVAPQGHSSDIKRLANALSAFFDTPLLPFGRSYDEDFDAILNLSSVDSMLTLLAFKLIPELIEVGPQIRISRLIWNLN